MSRCFKVKLSMPNEIILHIDAINECTAKEEALAAAQDGDWSMFEGGLQFSVDEEDVIVCDATEDNQETEEDTYTYSTLEQFDIACRSRS